MITNDIFEWLNEPTSARSSRQGEGWFFLASDVGLKRSENEDRVAVLRVSSRSQSFWCACLCDGMGGMAGGARAATMALSVFFSSLVSQRRERPEIRLRDAAMDASAQVARDVPGGGATLSAILVEGGTTHTLNIGDSRIFMVADGQVVRLTVDDTMKEAYGAEGSGLLQFIGMKSGLVPHIKKIDGSSERLIITSDGAHSIGEHMIGLFSAVADTDEKLGNRILDTANWMGGLDNASVIIARPNYSMETQPHASASDISVWSTLGRMKIAWPTGGAQQSTLPRVAQEAAVAAGSVTIPETKSATEAAAIKSGDPVQHRQSAADAPAPKKKTGKRPTKKDQIEIGFSDEDNG